MYSGLWRRLWPAQKRGPTRLGLVVHSALDGGEPAIDIPVKKFVSVRDRQLEVAWTSRALRQRGGAGESALAIRRHDRRPRSSAFDGIAPPEPVLLNETGSAAEIFALGVSGLTSTSTSPFGNADPLARSAMGQPDVEHGAALFRAHDAQTFRDARPDFF
jgi:hypothetical protein